MLQKMANKSKLTEWLVGLYGQNGDKPERQHYNKKKTRTVTNWNGDKPKRRHGSIVIHI